MAAEKCQEFFTFKKYGPLSTAKTVFSAGLALCGLARMDRNCYNE